MAALPGGGSSGGMSQTMEEEAHVTDLLGRLNLTKEEEEFVAFSDDEESGGSVSEHALIGKVMSPSSLHISTIAGAMRPAWGNPYGLLLRSVGEKKDSMFIAEFASAVDKKKALEGSPWIVGKYSVILQEYKETLKASDVIFTRMEMWVRILNLPFGWMNDKRGARVAGLIGDLVKMDVDAHGKASGPYLRARVAVEINKPLRRGVMLQSAQNAVPEWYDIQYEKLPFYCFSCGLMGHLDSECKNPQPRDAEGKLPYEKKKLRAPDDRRKPMSFGQAASESYGRLLGLNLTLDSCDGCMLTMSSAEFGRRAGLAVERVAHDEQRRGRVLRGVR
ncbi:hypothetical protein QOZ80_6BG0472640 [Eleusine coracana subsp. coracana]|nr:hypothetical protein QOZ80_6BG0472640 [Eleusine coracana subsp. coracana]